MFVLGFIAGVFTTLVVCVILTLEAGQAYNKDIKDLTSEEMTDFLFSKKD
jgi:hypothetical protein